MHVGIANPWWRGKRSRRFGACVTCNFTYLARGPWASYQIRKFVVCTCAGNAGNFPRNRLKRKPLVSDPGVHHGTCVTHVMIANPRCRGKRSRHPRRLRNPQSYVSTKRPMWPLHMHHPQPINHSDILDYLIWYDEGYACLCLDFETIDEIMNGSCREW